MKLIHQMQLSCTLYALTFFCWSHGLALDIQSSQSHLHQYIHVRINSEHAFVAKGKSPEPGWCVQDFQTRNRNWTVRDINVVSEQGCFELSVAYIGHLKNVNTLSESVAIGSLTWLQHLFSGGENIQGRALTVEGQTFLHQHLRIMLLQLCNGYTLKVCFGAETSSVGDEGLAGRYASFEDLVTQLNSSDECFADKTSCVVRVSGFGEVVSQFCPRKGREVKGITLLSATPGEKQHTDSTCKEVTVEAKAASCRAFFTKSCIR